MLVAIYPVLLVLTVILFFTLLYLWVCYNSFTRKRNQVKTDLSDVNVQVKRKADLLDRLVSLTKEYAKHEKGTFEDVAKARSALDTSKNAKQVAQAENMLSDTLKSLFMVTEDNPKLRANENYLALRDDLKTTEDAIAQYREEYNRTVQEYNNNIQIFPNLLAARLFVFEDEALFQA